MYGSQRRTVAAKTTAGSYKFCSGYNVLSDKLCIQRETLVINTQLVFVLGEVSFLITFLDLSPNM